MTLTSGTLFPQAAAPDGSTQVIPPVLTATPYANPPGDVFPFGGAPGPALAPSGVSAEDIERIFGQLGSGSPQALASGNHSAYIDLTPIPPLACQGP